mmetsp:Transcript_29306/g.49950  ORF Transcript_29306/g.49950 Transcript_29306/m.49950 type:complete len:114 (+) Transcript_29306:235-576(+)
MLPQHPIAHYFVTERKETNHPFHETKIKTKNSQRDNNKNDETQEGQMTSPAPPPKHSEYAPHPILAASSTNALISESSAPTATPESIVVSTPAIEGIARPNTERGAMARVLPF